VSLSYREAHEAIRKTAAYLRSLGLEKGAKIALTGKNSPEWAIAYLAILEAGAVVVPIDYQLSLAETVNLVNASDSVILFVDEERRPNSRPPVPASPRSFPSLKAETITSSGFRCPRDKLSRQPFPRARKTWPLSSLPPARRERRRASCSATGTWCRTVSWPRPTST